LYDDGDEDDDDDGDDDDGDDEAAAEVEWRGSISGRDPGDAELARAIMMDGSIDQRALYTESALESGEKTDPGGTATLLPILESDQTIVFFLFLCFFLLLLPLLLLLLLRLRLRLRHHRCADSSISVPVA
jgi:hypothetical protein